MVAEEAGKLSWKNFRNYMVSLAREPQCHYSQSPTDVLRVLSDQIRNGGIEKSFSRKSEVKVFYVDEEEDEIFVDTDDEYRSVMFRHGRACIAGLGTNTDLGKQMSFLDSLVWLSSSCFCLFKGCTFVERKRKFQV